MYGALRPRIRLLLGRDRIKYQPINEKSVEILLNIDRNIKSQIN